MLLFVGWACAFLPDIVGKWTGYTYLNTQALDLTQDALDRNLKSFLSVSAIKAVVALIEGSTVGMGFQLQVGDLVQPAYDYIDFVWKLLLYSLLILGFYHLLLQTGILTVGIQIIGLGLLFWGAAMLYPLSHLDARAWARRLVLLGVLVAFVVPLALLGTHFVSSRYMAPLKARYAARIDAMQSNLEVHKAAFLNLKEEISITSPADSIDALRARASTLMRNVTTTVWDALQVMLFFVIIQLLELLVFPLLSAYVLYKFLHFALGRVITATIEPPAHAPAAPAEV
jgi:hypothetical protein